MATFVLVHGSWHGAWCWEALTPQLKAQGHAVIAPDLPGHGSDRTPAWRVTLGGFVQRVVEASRGASGPLILVGHSMGGLVITETAARNPGLAAGLVYVCAFVPRPGERLIQLAMTDQASKTVAAMRRGLLTTGIRSERAAEVFYGRCPPAVAGSAVSRLRAEPMLPLLQRVSQPAGPLPARAYVECSADQAISIGHQRMMHRRAGIETVTTLDSDHSPFYSAAEALVSRLVDQARVWSSNSPDPAR